VEIRWIRASSVDLDIISNQKSEIFGITITQ